MERIIFSNFKFNVTIALFYEAYNTLNRYSNLEIKNKYLINSITKIMKLLIPFIPHLANEALELLKCENKNQWPSIKKGVAEEMSFAAQVNGKTRDIITVKKDLNQDQIERLIKESSKVRKFLEDKKIIKTIFVKNKIINFIIK